MPFPSPFFLATFSLQHPRFSVGKLSLLYRYVKLLPHLVFTNLFVLCFVAVIVNLPHVLLVQLVNFSSSRIAMCFAKTWTANNVFEFRHSKVEKRVGQNHKVDFLLKHAENVTFLWNSALELRHKRCGNCIWLLYQNLLQVSYTNK